MIIFIGLVLANCFTNDYLKIVGHHNEVIEYPLTVISGVNLTDENQKVTLIHDIEIIQEIEFPSQRIYSLSQIAPLTNFITISVYKDDNYEWLNKYQILGERNEFMLMATDSLRPGTQSRTPFFNTYYNLEASIYYSSSILDSNHILIDCSDTQTNYFYLIDQAANIKTKIPNNYPYQNSQRQIYTTDQYIYRSTKPSNIEIFQYDLQTNNIVYWITIDQQFVQQFITTEYEFKFIECQIGKNDEIIILDKYGNILQFQIYLQTFDFKYIASNLGESLTFDFDFLNNHYAVLQKNKLIYNSLNYQTKEDLSQSKIHLAKHFVFLTSPTKITLFDKSLTLLSVYEGNFTYTLSNFKQNDFFTFNSKIIQHYSLSEFKIRYINNDGEEGSASLSLNGRTITIDYQNVENNFPGLIQVSKGRLVDKPFTSSSYIQPSNHLVDGPEIQLEISSNIDYVGDQKCQADFKSQNITFVYVLSQDFDFSTNHPYYIVTQNQDKLLTIYQCTLFLSQNCAVYATHQLQIELNNENLKLLHIENSIDRCIYVAVLVNPNKLTIHQFSYSGEHHEKSYLSEYEIDYFYFTKITDDNLLIVYCSRLQSLRVYLFSTMKILYHITPEKVQELGITYWNPQQIFSNDYEQWTFILNGDKEIIIFDLQVNSFSIVYIFSIQPCKDLKVMIFQDRFGIIQQFESNKIQLLIYNKQDETNIYLEKKPSWYSYQPSLEHLNYFSFHGILNIKARKSEQSVILTYLIDQTAHNMLHSVINYDDSIKFIRSTTNKIFLFYPDYLEIFEIQFNPRIVARNISFDNNNFLSNIESTLTYSNTQTKLEIDQTFRFVNTYQKVKINTQSMNFTSTQKLGVDWYSGFVSLFEIKVNSSSISVVNPIQQQISEYQSSTLNVADVDQYILILKQKEILLINKQTNQKDQSYSFVDNLLCSNILSQEKGNILLLCSYLDKQVIQGIQCSGSKCIIGQSWMEKKDNIFQVQLIGDIIFIVLSLKVEIYIGSILDLEKALLCEIFDYQVAITIQQVYQNRYQIYYVDNNLLTIQEYLLTDNKFISKINSTLDLESFINQDYYFTQCSFITISNILQSEERFQGEFIFYSDTGPHYCILLEFEKENDTYVLKSKLIKFIIQGYGTYRLSIKSFPFIQITNDYVIIPYISNNLILTVYQKSYQLDKSIQFLGLLRIQNTPFLSYQIQNQTYLLANPNQLALYQIHNSPQLVINGSIQSTQGELKISNDYTSDSIQVNIYVPTTNEQSHTLLWIIISIIGGIMIFGGVFYLYKKKNRKVETFIVN